MLRYVVRKSEAAALNLIKFYVGCPCLTATTVLCYV
jgi:hypothetical protein